MKDIIQQAETLIGLGVKLTHTRGKGAKAKLPAQSREGNGAWENRTSDIDLIRYWNQKHPSGRLGWIPGETDIGATGLTLAVLDVDIDGAKGDNQADHFKLQHEPAVAIPSAKAGHWHIVYVVKHPGEEGWNGSGFPSWYYGSGKKGGELRAFKAHTVIYDPDSLIEGVERARENPHKYLLPDETIKGLLVDPIHKDAPREKRERSKTKKPATRPVVKTADRFPSSLEDALWEACDEIEKAEKGTGHTTCSNAGFPLGGTFGRHTASEDEQAFAMYALQEAFRKRGGEKAEKHCLDVVGRFLDGYKESLAELFREAAKRKNLGMDRPTILPVAASEATPKEIDWIIPGWIARGKLHYIIGKSLVGKTTILVDLLARLGKRRNALDYKASRPLSALYWSSEDALEDALLPKLIEADGDLTRFKYLNYETFDPALDMAALAPHLEGIDILVLDPIISVLQGSNNDPIAVRESLEPVCDLAARYGVAVIGIAHTRKELAGVKDMPDNLIDTQMGSSAWGQVVRVAWFIQQDKALDGEARPKKYSLMRVKNSYGTQQGGFRYEITGGKKNPKVARVEWLETLDGDAEQVLRSPSSATQKTARETASKSIMILGTKADGAWVKTSEACTEIEHERGIARATVQRGFADLETSGQIERDKSRGLYRVAVNGSGLEDFDDGEQF